MAEFTGDEITLSSYNPDPKLIRRNALLDMFAIVPWVMAGVVHSSKEIVYHRTIRGTIKLGIETP